jgi:hypothetical protein
MIQNLNHRPIIDGAVTSISLRYMGSSAYAALGAEFTLPDVARLLPQSIDLGDGAQPEWYIPFAGGDPNKPVRGSYIPYPDRSTSIILSFRDFEGAGLTSQEVVALLRMLPNPCLPHTDICIANSEKLAGESCYRATEYLSWSRTASNPQRSR